ncbi:MAG: glutathione S-transferase [Alphaproteobacteria bacterium]|nr:glutathione S-transferase [Alphaproteobacteria bacterium]
MKLRHSPASPYVRKVMIVAIESGLAGRIETVPTTVLPVKPNDSLKPENPLVKIPALTTDDGETLYDSPVICEYLDSLHGGTKFFPPAGAARWTALRRQALGDGVLDAAILCRYETAARPKALQWADWIEGQMRKVRGALDAIEGERLDGVFDIGTITIACALGYLDFRFPDENWRKTHPRLAAWFAEVSKRPSMKETVPQG